MKAVDKSTIVDDDRPDPPLVYKKRATTIGITAHGDRLPEYQKAFARHACTVRFFSVLNGRGSYWRVEDAKSGAQICTGFDIDLDRALKQLDAGLKLEFVDLLQAEPQALRRSNPSNAGGPFCVVCDTQGGLPCPSMVSDALKYGVKLAYPAGDARLGPAHVHPGRCRKRLREWLNTAQGVRK